MIQIFKYCAFLPPLHTYALRLYSPDGDHLFPQVPDRLCVTAPSGDRSRSYIHLKTQPHDTEHRAAEVLETEQVLLWSISLKRQISVIQYSHKIAMNEVVRITWKNNVQINLSLSF